MMIIFLLTFLLMGMVGDRTLSSQAKSQDDKTTKRVPFIASRILVKFRQEISKRNKNQLIVVMGYIQHLLPKYRGPSHLVIRDRLTWTDQGGCLYEWEEVEGPAANDDKADLPNILRVELVGTEPYQPGDARRKREAEVQQNGVLQ